MQGTTSSGFIKKIRDYSQHLGDNVVTHKSFFVTTRSSHAQLTRVQLIRQFITFAAKEKLADKKLTGGGPCKELSQLQKYYLDTFEGSSEQGGLGGVESSGSASQPPMASSSSISSKLLWTRLKKTFHPLKLAMSCHLCQFAGQITWNRQLQCASTLPY
jgi:hypothetical protein